MEQHLFMSSLIAQSLCITLDATTGVCLRNVQSLPTRRDRKARQGRERHGKV